MATTSIDHDAAAAGESANFLAGLANSTDGRQPRRRARRGRAATAYRTAAAREDAGRRVGGDRHLGLHAVPARVGPAAADPGVAARAGPRVRSPDRRARPAKDRSEPAGLAGAHSSPEL